MMTPEILENQEKLVQAQELSSLWNSYFPALAVDVSHWRLLLDGHPKTSISKAIRKCTQKYNREWQGRTTVKQMLAYIGALAYKIDSVKPQVVAQ